MYLCQKIHPLQLVVEALIFLNEKHVSAQGVGPQWNSLRIPRGRQQGAESTGWAHGSLEFFVLLHVLLHMLQGLR